jgi:hypothetical protein
LVLDRHRVEDWGNFIEIFLALTAKISRKINYFSQIYYFVDSQEYIL